MAKRTKLTAPSAEDLAKLDADFRSEKTVRPNPATAPIASVAAETALTSDVEPAQQKLNRLDAEALRAAQDTGRLIVEIPIGDIDALAMVRDRTVLEEAELKELEMSIKANGLRLPIEVYKTAEGYGLLSGYRRLLAVRRLWGNSRDARFETIKALVRPAADAGASFVAMVEENEVRANLSHFERGRIAVISAAEGAFATTEDAINALFAAASPAKRSKVKTFAEVFASLGDLLTFPTELSERRGLRLGAGIRQGGERALRDTLGAKDFASADEEWSALEPVIKSVMDHPVETTKRGRPKAAPLPGWDGETLHLKSGVSLRKERDQQGYLIRIGGKGVSAETLERILDGLQVQFDREW